MSIRIHKAGILDTIQDLGRFGSQHWGVNPGGAMDTVAMQVANILAGNPMEEPVIEMHFPAAEMIFDAPAVFALAGADFTATLDDQPLPVNQPALAVKGSVLKFGKQQSGSKLYFSVHGGLAASTWLKSCSTHLKVGAGGYHGRALQKNDTISFRNTPEISTTVSSLLSWKANLADLYANSPFYFLPGAEYDLLISSGKDQLLRDSFSINRNSDRMGYRLEGSALHSANNDELISTAVTRGTMQLLPDGQLIILMADHQTTGGYPRLGNVITAHLPSLSQLRPGDCLQFAATDIITAENLLVKQQRSLQQLQNACTFRLQEYLSARKI